MKNNLSDRRIRKTKDLLRKTLTELLMEKDLKNITISELTERADINRGTFYLHYKDIYDLYEQIEKELLDDFVAIIARHRHQQKVLGLSILKRYLPVYCRKFRSFHRHAAYPRNELF